MPTITDSPLALAVNTASDDGKHEVKLINGSNRWVQKAAVGGSSVSNVGTVLPDPATSTLDFFILENTTEFDGTYVKKGTTHWAQVS